MGTRSRALPAGALRQGLTAEILQDRACSSTLDAAFTVHAALGFAHAADTYRNALAHELKQRGLRPLRQASFSVVYKERVVGTYRADLLVEDRILVQVISEQHPSPNASTDLIRGLHASDLRVGLLFNFGLPELAFARIL